MKHELRLTDIGEGLEEAEIITWLVQVGDEVSRDQPIVEVMTDKSNAELPAPSAGTILSLGEAPGSIIHVGDLLAVIDDSATAVSHAGTVDPAPPTAAVPTPPATAPDSPPLAQPEAIAVAQLPYQQRPKASPSTRRTAAERGIDLAQVAGSGPGGRILLSDLDQPVALSPTSPGAFSAAAAPTSEPVPSVAPQPSPPPPPPPPPPAVTVSAAPAPAPVAPAVTRGRPASSTEPLRGVRRAIARNMAQSWSQIPHIHAFAHIDAEPLLEIRARLRATDVAVYQRLTPLSFFVAAVARALEAFPQANASLDMDAGTITTHGEINVGVAVAAPQGLLVPVIRNAAALSFEDLCEYLQTIVVAARDGRLATSDFQGGTATVTNFGSLGGEQATPLIRPPESVIIGFGSIDTRPFVIGDELVAHKTMHLVIGADHRLLDGDVTTALLNHVATSLSDPLGLVL